MTDREVKQSGKDDEGDITALCNHGQGWSPRMKNDAIRDIENNVHRYYVDRPGRERVWVHVVRGRDGKKYLRTSKDETTHNNLDDLPDC